MVNNVFSKITSSKLFAVIAVVLVAVGVVLVFYSISQFFPLAPPASSPPVTSQPTPTPTATSTPALPPSLTHLNSSIWAGYVVSADFQSRQPEVSSVSGSWTVPEVAASQVETFSGTWIGIGGFNDRTLIQTGTEQQFVNGRTQYFAWYELLPGSAVIIRNMVIRPNDVIKASISLIDENTSSWSIQISDLTRGGSFSQIFSYNSNRATAEWILERPNVNGDLSPLADFGSITFTDCTATIANNTGTISDFSNIQFSIYDENNAQLTNVTSLEAGGSSFTVSYVDATSTVSVNNAAVHDFSANWVLGDARKIDAHSQPLEPA